MKFGLTEGMSKERILDEFKIVGVSGETQSQVYEFLHPREQSLAGKSKAVWRWMMSQESVSLNEKGRVDSFLHGRPKLKSVFDRHLNVVRSNDDYAILREDRPQYDRNLSRFAFRTNYYLSGKSDDEEKYFLHGLQDGDVLDRVLKMIDHNIFYPGDSMREFVDYIDRKDEGYQKRLQGNLLVATVPYEKHAGKNRLDTTPIYHPYVTFKFGGRQFSFDEHHKLTGDALVLGRHTIRSSAIGAIYRGLRFTAVTGPYVSVRHPQHHHTMMDIPHGELALIAMQRGPDERQGMRDVD